MSRVALRRAQGRGCARELAHLPAHRLLVLAIGLTVAGATAAAAADEEPTIAVSLAPATIGVEDMAELTIELSSSGMGGVNGKPTFALDNLEVIDGPSRSSGFQFVNGRTTTSLSFSWTLRPLATGVARVTGVAVELAGGRMVQLADQQIQVEPGSLAPPPQARDPFRGIFGGDPFGDPFGRERRRAPQPQRAPKVQLRAEVSDTTPWLGQQVTYRVVLYTQANISQVEPTEVPAWRGFWAEDLPTPKDARGEMVVLDGERWGRVELLARALFPLAPGPVEIEPYRARLGVQVPEMGAFGPIFARTQAIERATGKISLEVRALPQPAPASFGGAVGSIHLAATLDPPIVDLGEASTLTVTLEGEGHLQGLGEPRLPAYDGVRRFPPHTASASEQRAGKVRGTRSWSYVLVPERAGSWHLPPIEIGYFDPKRGDFAVAATTPLALTARGPAVIPAALGAAGPAPVAPASPGAEGATPAAGGLEPPADASIAPLRARWWLGIFAVLAAAVALVVVRAVRQPHSRRASRQALAAALRHAAAESRPRQAAAAIEEAWREYLVERWQIPPGTPSTRWAELLAAQGTSEAVGRELVALADELHYLRYAPQLASAEALQREVVERSDRLRRQLR